MDKERNCFMLFLNTISVCPMPFIKAYWVLVQPVIFHLFNTFPERLEVLGPKQVMELIWVMVCQITEKDVWQKDAGILYQNLGGLWLQHWHLHMDCRGELDVLAVMGHDISMQILSARNASFKSCHAGTASSNVPRMFWEVGALGYGKASLSSSTGSTLSARIGRMITCSARIVFMQNFQ